MTSEEAMLADINNAVEDLHTKLDALAAEVQVLTAAMEELLPAARRAAAMMGKTKAGMALELLRGR